MKQNTKLSSLVAVATVFIFGCAVTNAAPKVGEMAPEFMLSDTFGNDVSSADLIGKTVVLEWTNHGCPYVKKHYNSQNMQVLQKEAVADDVVWISVISSAEGKQGSVSAEEANELTTTRDASPSHVLLDLEGTMGRAYDARTTPHMFVIDPEGKLTFMGGIDDKPTADSADIEGANNYVRTALAEMKEGKVVSTPTSRPYGCSVKYKT